MPEATATQSCSKGQVHIIGEKHWRDAQLSAERVQADVSLSSSNRAAEILFEASCSSNNEGAEGQAHGEGASRALIDSPPPT